MTATCQAHPEETPESRAKNACAGCASCLLIAHDYCQCHVVWQMQRPISETPSLSREDAERAYEIYGCWRVIRNIMMSDGSYDPDQPLKPYLVKIADWAAIDYLRRQPPSGTELPDNAGEFLPFREAGPSPTQKNRTDQKERTKWEVLEPLCELGLDELDIQIIWWGECSGLKAEQVAGKLRILRSRVYRTRLKYHKALHECGIGGEIRWHRRSCDDADFGDGFTDAEITLMDKLFKVTAEEVEYDNPLQQTPDSLTEYQQTRDQEESCDQKKVADDLEKAVRQLQRVTANLVLDRIFRIAGKLKRNPDLAAEEFIQLFQNPALRSLHSVKEWLDNIVGSTELGLRWGLERAGVTATAIDFYIAARRNLAVVTISKNLKLTTTQINEALDEVKAKTLPLWWELPVSVRNRSKGR